MLPRQSRAGCIPRRLGHGAKEAQEAKEEIEANEENGANEANEAKKAARRGDSSHWDGRLGQRRHSWTTRTRGAANRIQPEAQAAAAAGLQKLPIMHAWLCPHLRVCGCARVYARICLNYLPMR
jgi:hypothetical protein